MKGKNIFILGILFIIIGGVTLQAQGNFPRYCLEDPNNLVQNCQFNEGLNHWTPFVEGGGVDIGTIDGDQCHTINHPCGYMSSSGGFVAGLYQQIPATPGGVYNANAQLILYDSYDKADGAMGRKVGIDPMGGTDPHSPNIVWGPEVFGSLHTAGHQLVWEDLQVTATAQAETVTLFVRINNLGRVVSPIHQVWLDEIGMIQIGQAERPVPDTPVPPTSTPVPPTNTPVPLPTETPVPVDTATPIPTETPVPVDTATPIPTVTPNPTETPTATPTETPQPTPTASMTPTSGAERVAAVNPANLANPANPAAPNPQTEQLIPVLGAGVFCLGLGGFGFGTVILGGLYWLYRLGQEEERSY